MEGNDPTRHYTGKIWAEKTERKDLSTLKVPATIRGGTRIAADSGASCPQNLSR
jgi:hypothetical protein